MTVGIFTFISELRLNHILNFSNILFCNYIYIILSSFNVSNENACIYVDTLTHYVIGCPQLFITFYIFYLSNIYPASAKFIISWHVILLCHVRTLVSACAVFGRTFWRQQRVNPESQRFRRVDVSIVSKQMDRWGFEPQASAMPRRRSTAELPAPKFLSSVRFMKFVVL